MRNTLGLAFVLTLTVAACGDDDAIDSNEEARRAYLGLDASIEKSLGLGFDGFNSAQSANIDPQAMPGDSTGMLTITGQVDQGESDNKGMRLNVGMVEYSDGVIVVVYDDEEEVEVNLTYDTTDVLDAQPYLELSLRDIPADGSQATGTFTGTLTGTYILHGDIEGEVDLSLIFSGQIMDSAGDTVRVPGSTTVTGSATSGDGLYEVSLTL